MTALAVILAACLTLLAATVVVPRLREGRAYRRQAEAADEVQAATFLHGLGALPLDADPEQHAEAVDRHSRSAQQARRAQQPSDQPHGTVPRRYP